MPDDKGDLGDAVKRARSKKLRNALERTEELKAAEARAKRDPRLNWRGPWNRKSNYDRGDVVYHDGSSWRAVIRNDGSEPGELSKVWEYVAKKGRDGKKGETGASGIGIVGPVGPPGPPGPGSSLEVEDESVPLGPATIMDFTGAGVTASVVGNTATVNVPGGGSGVEVEDEGVLQGIADTLNFAGTGVSASVVGTDALITIAGGAPGTEYNEDTPMQDGDLGNFVLAVRNDTDAVTTDADGDFSQISVDSAGRVKVTGTVAVSEPVSVDDNGGSLTVDGTVAVSNFPATQPVSGTVSVVEPVSVDDNGGSLTVDGTVSVSNFPATQPVSGTVAISQTGTDNDVNVTGSLPAGTNNIGDVDVLTVPAPLSTTGGGTEATAQRVTIANDSTGVLSVDDNGGSLTVDGTVTATVASDKAEDTAHVSGDTGSFILAVRNDAPGSFCANGEYSPISVDAVGYVGVTTRTGNPLLVSANPSNTPSDWGLHAEDIASVGSDVGVLSLGIRHDTPADTTSNDGDFTAASTDSTGAQFIHQRNGVIEGRAVKTAFLDTNTNGDNTLVAAVTSKKIRVLSLQMGVGATAVNVFFRSGTGGTQISMLYRLPAAVMPFGVSTVPGGFLFETAAGSALVFNLSAANNCNVQIQYLEV